MVAAGGAVKENAGGFLFDTDGETPVLGRRGSGIISCYPLARLRRS